MATCTCPCSCGGGPGPIVAMLVMNTFIASVTLLKVSKIKNVY